MITLRSQKGFTLIEMVVAIALFIVVALVAIVGLLNVVDANKKAQGLKTAVSNLNYTLESMSREMRVGSNYSCYSSPITPKTAAELTGGCPSGEYGEWTVAFETSEIVTCGDGSRKKLINAYYFNGKSLYKGEQTTCGGSYSWFPLVYGSSYLGDPRATESYITFTRGDVKVVSEEGKQPYARIHFAGYAGTKERIRSYFDIQTMVSQRLGQ